jgi:hypothetical protein
MIQRWRLVRPVLASLLLAATFVATGCGGSEEAAAPAVEAPKAAAPAEAAAVAAPVPAALPAGAPATLTALQLLPAEAQVGIAAPALNGVVATLLALDARIEAIDLKAELDKAVEDLKKDANAPDAQSLGDIAAAKGLSLDAPMAVFADFSGTAASMAAAAAAAQAEGGAPMDDADVAPPAVAVVVGVSDQAKAEAFIAELVALDGELSGAPVGSENVGGITVATRGDYAHFFAGNQLVVGVASLVKGAAARVAAPATFRYGTPECPVTAQDELVGVVYGNRMLPHLKALLAGTAAMDPGAKALAAGQLAMAEQALASASDEPMLVNLALSEKALNLTTRIDFASYPGMKELSGEAAPLALTQLLPVDTLALVSLVLTDAFKNQVKTQVLPAAQESITDPGMAQGMSMANQVLDMLGNEIAIGLAPVPNDFPAAFIMLSLSNPEPTKGLLQMLVPMMPDEALADYGISSVAAPIPVPLSIAFEGNMVLVSNNVDGMKKIIDLARAKSTSGLFAALQPPLDPSVPRYQALVLNTNLITDIVMPLMALAGGMDPETQPIVDAVGSVVREVRMVSEMDGNWNKGVLTVDLKDAA